jgi:hypothetical protein
MNIFQTNDETLSIDTSSSIKSGALPLIQSWSHSCPYPVVALDLLSIYLDSR